MTTDEINSIEVFKKRSPADQLRLLQKIKRENHYINDNFENRIKRLEELAEEKKIIVDEDTTKAALLEKQAKEQQEQKLRAEILQAREEKQRLREEKQNHLNSIAENLIKEKITIGHILEVIRDSNNFNNVTLGRILGISGCNVGSKINHKPVIGIRYYINFLAKLERFLHIDLADLISWNYKLETKEELKKDVNSN